MATEEKQASLIDEGQIQVRHPISTDCRGTPGWLFETLQARYAIGGRFDLDACAQAWNAKVPNYITPEVDALSIDWHATSVWANFPYSDLLPWLRHAKKQIEKGNIERIVMLLPVRGSSPWFQTYRPQVATETFLPFRVDFDYPPGERSPNSPYESSVVWVMEQGIRMPPGMI